MTSPILYIFQLQISIFKNSLIILANNTNISSNKLFQYLIAHDDNKYHDDLSLIIKFLKKNNVKNCHF